VKLFNKLEGRRQLREFLGDLGLGDLGFAATNRTMMKVDRWSIDKLDSSNWTTWKFQIKHFLLARGLWNLVNGSEVIQEDTNLNKLTSPRDPRRFSL